MKYTRPQILELTEALTAIQYQSGNKLDEAGLDSGADWRIEMPAYQADE